MILPNVGLNEWGHGFWIMEERFTAPFHWGFVILGWTELACFGLILQLGQDIARLIKRIYGWPESENVALTFNHNLLFDVAPRRRREAGAGAYLDDPPSRGARKPPLRE